MSTSPYYTQSAAEMYTPIHMCHQEANEHRTKFTLTDKTTAEDITLWLEHASPLTGGKMIALLGAYNADGGMSTAKFLKVLAAIKAYRELFPGVHLNAQLIFCINKPAKLPEAGKPSFETRARNTHMQLTAYHETFSGRFFRPNMVLELLPDQIRHVSSDSWFSNFTKLRTPMKAIDFFHPTTKHGDSVRDIATDIEKMETFIQDASKSKAADEVQAAPDSNDQDFKRVTQIAPKYEKSFTIQGRYGATVNSIDGVECASAAAVVSELNKTTKLLIRATTDPKEQKRIAQDLIIADHYFNGARPIAHGDLCAQGETRTFFIESIRRPGVNTLMQAAGYLFAVGLEQTGGSTPISDLIVMFNHYGVEHEEAALYEGFDPDTQAPIFKPDHSYGGPRIHRGDFILQTPIRFKADGSPAPAVPGFNAQYHSAEITKVLLGGTDKEFFNAVCDYIGQPMDKRTFIEVPAEFEECDSAFKTRAAFNADNVMFAARLMMERAFDLMSGYEGPPLFAVQKPTGRSLTY